MKRKRWLSLVLVVVLVMSMVGCGDKAKDANTTTDKATEEPTKEDTATEAPEKTEAADLSADLTVLSHRTDLIDTKFAEYVKTFNVKYPNIKINFEPITDYENDVAIRMSTTEYGDVLMIPNSVPTGEFKDFFEPLGTVEEMKALYKDEFVNAKISEGNVYGLASCANAQGVVYNKKVFADAGVTELPKTPEEFLAALQKIKDNTEAIPYYTNFAAGWTLTAWQDHAFGSVSADADYHNNTVPNEENPFTEGKSHYTIYKLMYDIVNQELCEEEPVTSDWEKSKGMINNGEIGCMVLGSWAVSQMKGAGENPDDIGYMAFPFNIDGQQYATAGADYCYSINKNSKNKEAARAWIDFMVNESGFALSEGSISIVDADPLPDTLKDFAEVKLVVDNPATPENEGLFDELSNESEVGLYKEIEKQRICEAAMGSSKESFEDIMKDWNERWTEAQKELIK